MPRVSVVIPTYNRRDFVQAAIDSVLAQTVTDYEVIVVDDGSTDRTGDALSARYGERIRYVWQKNQGESRARNKGIDLARGEYVAFLDSDDLWLPQKLARQVTVLEAKPDMVLVFASFGEIDERGAPLANPLPEERIRVDLELPSLCLHNMVGSPSNVMVRTEALKQVGGFDAAIQYGEDWELWLRLRLQGPFAYIDEPLASIRHHAGSQNMGRPNLEQAERLLSDRLHILEKVFALEPDSLTSEHKRKCLARQYGLAAFKQYGVGRYDVGRRYLTRAAQLDPSAWTDLKMLGRELVGIAFWSNQAGEFRSAQPGIQRVKETLAYHWPPTIPVSRAWRHRVLSQVYADTGFKSFRNGNRTLARSCLLRAATLEPSRLTDRGVLSILWQTTFERSRELEI